MILALLANVWYNKIHKLDYNMKNVLEEEIR